MTANTETKNLKRKAIIISAVSVIWWIISFFLEPLVFDTSRRGAVLPRYILVKTLCLGAMVLIVCYLYQIVEGILNRKWNPALRSTVYAVPVWIAVFALCRIRNVSLGAEEFNIIVAATKYDLMNCVFTYITPYIEMIMMMLVPGTDAPLILKILLMGLEIGYAAARIAEIYGTPAAPVLIVIAFLVPPAVRDSCSVHRCPMYGMLYFFLAAKLFCDWKEQKTADLKTVLTVSFMIAVLTWWRAEGIYFLALGPVLMLLTYRIPAEKLTQLSNHAINNNAIYDNAFCENSKAGSDITDVIDKTGVIDKTEVKAGADKAAGVIRSSGSAGTDRTSPASGTEKTYAKRVKAAVAAVFFLAQLLVWLPKTNAPELTIENYGKHQLTPFYNYALTGMLCSGLDREKNAEDLAVIEEYMHIDFIDILYDMYGEHIFDEGHATYHESYTAVNPDATEELLDTYEAAVRHLILKNPFLFIKAQVRAFHHISAHYDHMCLSMIFGNLWAVVLWLVAMLIWSAVRKNWTLFVLALCPVCHGCISTVFLPAAYFKYYYPEYLFAWLFLGIAVSAVLSRYRKQRLTVKR